jgi:hypothetical protein
MKMLLLHQLQNYILLLEVLLLLDEIVWYMIAGQNFIGSQMELELEM